MRKFIYFLALYLFIGMMACHSEDTQKSVLIYTKNGEGFVHDNIAESVKALKEICDELEVSYVVSDDPSIFQCGICQ